MYHPSKMSISREFKEESSKMINEPWLLMIITTISATSVFSSILMTLVQNHFLSNQASISWPESIHLCGEIHPKALARTLENIDEIHRKRIEKAK